MRIMLIKSNVDIDSFETEFYKLNKKNTVLSPQVRTIREMNEFLSKYNNKPKIAIVTYDERVLLFIQRVGYENFIKKNQIDVFDGEKLIKLKDYQNIDDDTNLIEMWYKQEGILWTN